MHSPPGAREHLSALLAALENPLRAETLVGGEDLVATARHHRLSPLLSAVAGDHLPKALAEPFRRDRVLTGARNLLLSQVAQECIGALQREGIEVVVLKGLAYELTLYESAGVRATGDIDILVRGEKRRAAFEVLDRLGFEPRAAAPGFDEPDYHEVAWSRREVEVDLHLALAPRARVEIDYSTLWAQVQPLRLGGIETWTLGPQDAILFHALHMAIDHFGVPAIYLADFARLVSRVERMSDVEGRARAWRCERPLATALALTTELLPRWRAAHPFAPTTRPIARVIRQYGHGLPSRPEQLLRKLMHFDGPRDALRYVLTQGRRNLREQVERRVRRRSARERLALSQKSG